jgi:hypothetical protein
MKTVAEILRDAEFAIRAVVEQIRPIGQYGNRAVVEDALDRMLRERAGCSAHCLDYGVEWSADNVLHVRVRSLFTGLTLAGKTRAELQGYDILTTPGGVAVFPEGVYEFTPDGQFTFTPSAPVQTIALSLTFPEAPHA